MLARDQAKIDRRTNTGSQAAQRQLAGQIVREGVGLDENRRLLRIRERIETIGVGERWWDMGRKRDYWPTGSGTGRYVQQKQRPFGPSHGTFLFDFHEP